MAAKKTAAAKLDDQLSPHFTRSEFACPHCGEVKVSAALVEALEKARARFYPRGLRIVSGYRCPDHNQAVGGAARSRHLVGDAADIEPTMTRAQAVALGFRGIGIVRATGKVCHVDMRPTAAVWAYDESGRVL